MQKITYLLGAGASCHALPVVEKIPERLKDFILQLESKELQPPVEGYYSDIDVSGLAEPISEYYKKMINSLHWLYKASIKHSSIDTFAKKLFLIGDNPCLAELKIGLSLFFAYEQINNLPDPRYDSFFASILDHSLKLPERVKILTWNYDSQIEISYSGFSGQEDIALCSKQLGVYTKSDNNPPGTPSVFKINGTTAFRPRKENYHKLFLTKRRERIDLELSQTFTRDYAEAACAPSEQLLSFAWEPEVANNLLVKINESVKETDVLVIIGYSFPYFNREIDRQIIVSMYQLKKVYIQYPYASDILERFESVKPNLTGLKLVPVIHTKQFLLPNEL